MYGRTTLSARQREGTPMIVMLKRMLSIVCMAVSIFLMTLPSGVKITFLAAPEENILFHVRYVPYFSLLPIGAGMNIFPIITFILSILILLVLLIGIVRNINRRIIKIYLLWAIICNVMILLPSRVTGIGITMLILHCFVLVFQISVDSRKIF